MITVRCHRGVETLDIPLMYERREKDLEILRQDCELAIIASHRRSNQISNTPEKKPVKLKDI